MTTHIHWSEQRPAVGGYVAAKDGTTTFYAARDDHSLNALAADYAAGYSFNEPGDVGFVLVAFDAADEEIERENFTARSEDGRRGYLVA